MVTLYMIRGYLGSAVPRGATRKLREVGKSVFWRHATRVENSFRAQARNEGFAFDVPFNEYNHISRQALPAFSLLGTFKSGRFQWTRPVS